MPRSPIRESRYYPELQHFETREEGNKLLKAWQVQLLKTPKFLLALLGYTVSVGGLVGLLSLALRPWLGFSPGAIGGLVGGVTGVTGMAALPLLWRRRCRRFLRTELIHRGVPICVPCGYDLRGQEVPRCPECGASFDPKLIPSRTN